MKNKKVKVGDSVLVKKGNSFDSRDLCGQVLKVTTVGDSYIETEKGYSGLHNSKKFGVEFEIIKIKKDPIVESVVKQFKKRSKDGISKYGTTLAENEKDDFLQHLKEELMDAVLYLEKLQTQKNK